MHLMDQREMLEAELKELRQRHRALDDEIAGLGEAVLPDQIAIRRLKKQNSPPS